MKKSAFICIILCCILPLTFLHAFGTEAQQQDDEVYGCHSLDANISFLSNEEIVENAPSVLLYEMNSDTLMYAWNADAPMDPGGMVKIMTALVAIEQGNLEDVVTVREDVLSTVPEDYFLAQLQADEVISLKDLLYCMMTGSANDAAAVIADHVGGNQMLFVGEMNRYAENLGCKNTKFTNALGLYDEKQYTTARDTARILKYALQNETFRELFGTVSYTVPSTNKSDQRLLITNNYLLSNEEVEIYYDQRVTGSRTGIAEDKTRCVASVASSGNMEMICVVMGSEDVVAENGYSVVVFGSYDETAAVLDRGFDGLQVCQILYPEQALTQKEVVNGECDVILGPQTSVFAVLPKEVKASELSYRYTADQLALQAPLTKGAQLSEVEVIFNDICVAKADLYVMNDVDVMQQAVVDDVQQHRSGNLRGVFLTIGIIVAAVILLVFILRIVYRLRLTAARNHSRRNRKNRRRSR